MSSCKNVQFNVAYKERLINFFNATFFVSLQGIEYKDSVNVRTFRNLFIWVKALFCPCPYI